MYCGVGLLGVWWSGGCGDCAVFALIAVAESSKRRNLNPGSTSNKN